MANWIGTARSNYFRVKDAEAFKKFVEESPGIKIYDTEGGKFVITPSDEGDGGWPRQTYDVDAGDYEEYDLAGELALHLAEGEVAVLMEVGSERRHYLTGNATAVAWDGRIEVVYLSQIYEKARQAFGVEPSPAEY